jgi:hypothetical protein
MNAEVQYIYIICCVHIYTLDIIMEMWIVVLVLVVVGICACVWSFVAGTKVANTVASNVSTERPEREVRDPRHIGDSSVLVQGPDIPTYLMSGSVETRVN